MVNAWHSARKKALENGYYHFFYYQIDKKMGGFPLFIYTEFY